MEKRQIGFERMKLDLLFLLTGSIKVEKNFSYDQQRDYYLEKLFPNAVDKNEIIAFGKQFKKFSEFMFPNNPSNVRNKKFLIGVLAECTLLNQMYLAEDITEMTNEPKIRAACLAVGKMFDSELATIFTQEIGRRHSMYSRNLTESEGNEFKSLMKTFATPFMSIFDAVKNSLTKKNSIVAEKIDAFFTVCKKLGVLAKDEFLFHLKLDALAEIQIGNNTHVDFFDSFKEGWREKFPEYKYCDEVESYIRQEKSGCISSYGNKLSSLRNETLLFDLLTEVKLKLALSEGVLTPEELRKALEQKIQQFPQEELRKTLGERGNKIMEYYSLNRHQNYCADIKSELVPYKAALLYVDEILTEEIFRRYKNSAGQAPTSSNRETEKKYELLISQKDAEIYDLKRDLEYYENIKSQEFRSDFSKYDEALTTLFRRMCEYKFGAPLSELYRMANSNTDIKAEDLNTVMKNFRFVFNSMGITPYDTNNVGKKLHFDSEDANVIYAVNEKDVVEGMNTGTLKYPGWKYDEKKIVLPLIVVDKEGA